MPENNKRCPGFLKGQGCPNDAPADCPECGERCGDCCDAIKDIIKEMSVDTNEQIERDDYARTPHENPATGWSDVETGAFVGPDTPDDFPDFEPPEDETDYEYPHLSDEDYRYGTLPDDIDF